MFPYLVAPPLRLGALTLDSFTVLVTLGLIVGHAVFVRWCERRGVERQRASHVLLAMYTGGFVGAHVVEVLLYQTDELRRDPWLVARVWEGGLSSFGGIAGGLLTGWAFMWARSMPWDRMKVCFDGVVFGFPFAWIFGRLGCALAHDHVGIRTTSWLAVRFPDGPRYDLGLLELLYTIGVAAAFALLDRRKRPIGFFFALFFAIYGPVRFVLDGLRVHDTRYLSWTPGQYASVAATLLGVAVGWRLLRAARTRTAPRRG